MYKKRKGMVICAIAIVILCASILTAIGTALIYSHRNLDFELDETLFLAIKSDNVTRLYYDRSGFFGKRMDAYEPVEFATVSASSEERVWTPVDEISDYVKYGFIAVEDRDFYEHHGINIKRSILAVMNYLFHFKSSFGASTITQQVIKNISGDSERTVKRKINEMIRAYHIETRHSKEEIMEVYLNVVPMGEGCAGIGRASEKYFGKSAAELSLSEACTLVGITNAPARYNPHTRPDACLSKRNTVLSSMLECGYIEKSEYESARNEPLGVVDIDDTKSKINSWFVETVCDELCTDIVKKYSCSPSAARSIILNSGLSIYTTMDPDVQNILEKYFEDTKNFPSTVNDGLELAMTICDPYSADLRAIVGGCLKKTANRVVNYALTPRAPGSVLKPLALYAPLVDCSKISWSTVFDDVPVSFRDNGNGEYIEYPKNSPAVYDGLITVADALAYSKNTVAVKLYNLLGAENIYRYLTEKYKFDTIVRSTKTNEGKVITDLAPSPLALGQLTKGIDIRNLTEAYCAFPSGGVRYEGRCYVMAFSAKGNITIEKPSAHENIFSPECAKVMTQMLSRVVDVGTAKSITLKEIVDTAGKTGTSGSDRDRLFVGYTPYFCAGVWCGYKNADKPVATAVHLKVWDEVMHKIHELKLREDNVKGFDVNNLLYLPYCKDSGEKFSYECIKDVRGNRMQFGYFIPGTEPREKCNRHVLCEYDYHNGGVSINRNCPREFIRIIALLDIRDRSFPKEIFVTDSEYVFKEMLPGEKIGDSYEIPYFFYTIPEGEYVGISKSRRQFNSACQSHEQ